MSYYWASEETRKEVQQMRFRDMNPNTMPGYGDSETWGGRRPYEPREYDEPVDWNRLTQDEMIDNEEEYQREQ